MTHVIIILIVLATISALRIVIGPTMWDRLMALNLVSAKLILLIVLLATQFKNSMFLDIAIVYALLGFIGVTFMSIFIQKRGRY